MAATSQVSRIAQLVDRLTPLANKQRGMRIEADDWNALVEVLQGILGVDRAQEETAQTSLEDRFALKVHEHLGQVTLAWLDPQLQAAQGNGSSVSTRITLVDMTQKLTGLGTEVARLTTLAETQQKVVDRFSVDEVDRAKVLSSFDTRFAGLENLRTVVTTLSGQLDGVKGNIDNLLELRKSLSDPQGHPLDINQMRQDLTDLEGLRDNLKGVDGSMLRVRDLELKIKELSDSVGIGGAGGLEGRLAQLSNDLEGRLNTRMDDRTNQLKDDLHAANTASENQLRTELTAQMETNRSSLTDSLGKQISDAESRVNAGLDSRVTAATDKLHQDFLQATQALVEERFSQVPGQIKTAVDAAAADLTTRLTTDLGQSLQTQLNGKVAEMEGKLNAQLNTFDGRITKMEQDLPSRITQEVAQAAQQLETRVGQQVSTQGDQVRQGLEAALGDRVKAAVTDATAGLDAHINATVDQRLGDVNGKISQAVGDATHSLPDQVRAEVQGQFTQINVTGQIQVATDKSLNQMRSELNQGLANQQARVSDAVAGAVNALRGEIATSVQAGVDNAVKQANTLMGGLRDELTKTINEGLTQTRADLTRDYTNQLNATSNSLKSEIKQVNDRVATRVVLPTG